MDATYLFKSFTFTNKRVFICFLDGMARDASHKINHNSNTKSIPVSSCVY